VDSCEFPWELEVQEARVEGGELAVRWGHDGRQSRYSLSWLLEHGYGAGPEVEPPPSSTELLLVEGRGRPLGEVAREALGRVRQRGAALVRRGGERPEEETAPLIDAFRGEGLRVIETHFGYIEDLRTDNETNQNTDQLGYTDAGVQLHTDQPFLEHPPRYQVLQGVRAADEGGENFLVDAEAAARYLRALDERAHELLSTVPVRFHRRQKQFERIVEAPLLQEGPRGFQVRYSYFTLAPFRLPFARMEEWYRAYDRFARLVREPRHQYRFLLQPGDFVLYDNHRMLHARTSFRGPRWVRGIYLDQLSFKIEMCLDWWKIAVTKEGLALGPGGRGQARSKRMSLEIARRYKDNARGPGRTSEAVWGPPL
jgi:gamma-butyrobetaine dioxygenase/trimethyllysine dioxygenase